ncbi:MAG: DUF1292 domain-containing protein [Lachnospiraceae bacterium]|nr:DUF1292 domain-containing protein [Lachnospiraceae bacterium]
MDKDDVKKIQITTDDGVTIDLYPVAETKLNGVNYVLVADSEADDGNAFILKEVETVDNDIAYELVDEETELNAIGDIFNELLDDVDIVEED